VHLSGSVGDANHPTFTEHFRRQRVAGSLRLVRAPNVYELRVYVGRDRSGRVKHRYERFAGSKRAAQSALPTLVAEVDQAKKSPVAPTAMWGSATTLNSAFAAWRLNG
jgi:hypothetical protein